MEVKEKVFVADLKIKEVVESVFLIKYIALVEGRDGRQYLNVVAADASGEVECRLWKQAGEVHEEIKKGEFALIKGKVNFYQGRKQVVITEIKRVPQEQVHLADFVVTAERSAEEMYKRLITLVKNQLDDVYIRDLLVMVLEDQEIKRRLLIWQAGKTIHHAYQAGLLEHILSCSELSVTLSSHYRANVNYVVAGAILHDLAKIYELTDGLTVDYTEEGKLVGHLAKGLEVIDRFTYRIKNFPYMTKMHLKHIVLSHHGSYEYGSPKIPQTTEAMLVHLIDYMDSKINSFEMVKRTDTTPGHWSGFVKHLDRIVFKGELPFFDEYQEERNHAPQVSATTTTTTTSTVAAPSAATQHQHQRPSQKPKELKQNLGKFLEGFKVENKE